MPQKPFTHLDLDPTRKCQGKGCNKLLKKNRPNDNLCYACWRKSEGKPPEKRRGTSPSPQKTAK
jgi:hypothetical protein